MEYPGDMLNVKAAPSLAALPGRLASLDQFRGYTVLAMFVVNFLGSFAVVPAILKHHNTYCSYADTVMPQFFFAAGFAYRLTYVRRSASMARRPLYLRYLRRAVGLIVLGALMYLGPDVAAALFRPPPDVGTWALRLLGRNLFQTLVHLGVTSLWIMPVIGAAPRARVAFAAASAALHVALSYRFYYDWEMAFPGIDGGPLGFLTWTVPMLAGAAAYDIVAGSPHAAVRRIAVRGAAMMLLGYALACVNLAAPNNAGPTGTAAAVFVEPPFVPPSRPVNYWTMSQRAGSVSYLVFGAGLSLALYALFYWMCDLRGLRWGALATLGSNALAGYVVHLALDELIKRFVSPEASAASVAGLLAVFLGCCYAAVRALEKRAIFLRL
ncbi:MAG: hypothetical protein HUU20_15350 [Pirellulales bacterium]|nr:hypothetical protein [Pirellulales bacterium]